MIASSRIAPRLGALAIATVLLAPVAVTAQDTEARLKRVERMLNTGTLVDLLSQVEQLKGEVRDLRGKIEVQNHELTQLKARQRELYLDVDGRLRRFEEGGVADAAAGGAPPSSAAAAPSAPAPASAPAASAPAPEPVAPAVDPLKEQADYQAAFNLLKEARYDEAAKALTAFMATYPQGSYSDNAQYWLGESYYVTRKFPQSLSEFQQLVKRYPSSQKYTHALLKIGYIEDELGNRDEAKRVLEDLVKRFPSSAAAGLAKKRLARLR